MNEKLGAALYWIGGIILTFVVTAMPIVIGGIAWVFGAQSDILRDLIWAWFFVSFSMALLSVFVVIPDVVNDWHIRYFYDTGRKMILYGNIIAWMVWLFIGVQTIVRRSVPDDDGLI